MGVGPPTIRFGLLLPAQARLEARGGLEGACGSFAALWALVRHAILAMTLKACTAIHACSQLPDVEDFLLLKGAGGW